MPNNPFHHADLSSCATIRQAVDQMVGSQIAVAMLDTLCSRIRFREFSTKSQSLHYATIVEAVETFTKSGDISRCEALLRDKIDNQETLHDLVRETMATDIFKAIVSGISERTARRFPEQTDAIGNLVVDVLLDRVISTARRNDPSTPLDILRGVELTLAYVPGFDATRDRRLPTSTYNNEGVDGLSILPDVAFRNFASLAGIDKRDWLSSAQDVTGEILYHAVEGDERSAMTARLWKRAQWSTSGDQLVEPIKLFDAVDCSNHGFTPLIAFTMDAFKFTNRDWGKSLAITGGVLGLHDFKDGTGEPLRFEATKAINAKPVNFILADKQKFPIAKSHGFTSDAFKARVRDARTKSPVAGLKQENALSTYLDDAIMAAFHKLSDDLLEVASGVCKTTLVGTIQAHVDVDLSLIEADYTETDLAAVMVNKLGAERALSLLEDMTPKGPSI